MKQDKTPRAGGFALDIGNTKTHGQVRGPNHELLDDWVVPTTQHNALREVIEQGYAHATQSLGGQPDFVGLGFGGPVDPKTGSATLTLVTKFNDTVTTKEVSEMLNGVPVVHLNDVAASAHALVFPHFTVDATLLTKGARQEAGPSVLIEIGTGVGSAYCLPDGTVMPSEAARIHASNGQPFGLNLCGSQGFIHITKELEQSGQPIPAYIREAQAAGDTLGPLLTQRIATGDTDEFTHQFARRYATYLGELLGTVQLAFLATRLFVGGSVGRAPGFLEHLLETDDFWQAFAKKDALRGRDMPILRVNDADATVRGAYAAAERLFTKL
jgi:predicted NBD/HSP70 family sugar kinase